MMTKQEEKKMKKIIKIMEIKMKKKMKMKGSIKKKKERG